MAGPSCSHFDGTVAKPRSSVCEECGDTHSLRLCTICGHVGCCESHKAHATAHARLMGHPIIKSLPIDEVHFTWCYICDRYLDEAPSPSPSP